MPRYIVCWTYPEQFSSALRCSPDQLAAKRELRITLTHSPAPIPAEFARFKKTETLDHFDK